MSNLKVKIYADGADLEAMKRMDSENLVSGFTTNPTLMARNGIKDYLSFAKQVLNEISEGKKELKYDSKNKGLSIEKIIDLTWKEKEEVPDIAAPRVRGSFKFWLTSFTSLQNILFEFGNKLTDDMLRVIAHAHPISGELDFHQRLVESIICYGNGLYVLCGRGI